jgi:hypothetical protein
VKVFALIAFLLYPIPAQAIPCWIVKKAVAQYGEAAVEAWARGKGYSPIEVARIRKACGI